MSRIFKVPFATQGDTEEVPVDTQGDGSVSLTQGFGYDYEREYEDPAAKDIRREVMNGLFHDVTEAIGDIQLSGVAKWDADAAPYPAGAIVWHASAAWLSTVGNNSAEPGTNANWSQQQASGTFLQASANLSDVPDAAAARTNLGIPQLGTAATRDVGSGNNQIPLNSNLGTAATRNITTTQTDTTAGRVLKVGDFGLGATSSALDSLQIDDWDAPPGAAGFYRTSPGTTGTPPGPSEYYVVMCINRGGSSTYIAVSSSAPDLGAMYTRDWNGPTSAWNDWRAVAMEDYVDGLFGGLGTMAYLNAGSGGTNFRNNTQNDARYALKSVSIASGAGLSGGGSLDANRTLSVNFGTTAGTAAQGNDGRINNGQTAYSWGNHAIAGYVPQGRTISAGAGLSGGGSLAANRTLSADFATTSEAQALESLTKLISPGRLGDAMNSHVLGMNQTWQDMSAMRAADTTYTNSTGRPIFVSISARDIGPGVWAFQVDGVEVGRVNTDNATYYVDAPMSGIVPAGSTYALLRNSGSADILNWSELR